MAHSTPESLSRGLKGDIGKRTVRRRLLYGVAVASVGLLAGCVHESGDGDSGDGEGADGDGGGGGGYDY